MLSKILNNKIVKISAIVLLPTVLVGGYYGVKWILKKKKELEEKKKLGNNKELENNKKNENI
jgi:hypothetical protein